MCVSSSKQFTFYVPVVSFAAEYTCIFILQDAKLHADRLPFNRGPYNSIVNTEHNKYHYMPLYLFFFLSKKTTVYTTYLFRERLFSVVSNKDVLNWRERACRSTWQYIWTGGRLCCCVCVYPSLNASKMRNTHEKKWLWKWNFWQFSCFHVYARCVSMMMYTWSYTHGLYVHS